MRKSFALIYLIIQVSIVNDVAFTINIICLSFIVVVDLHSFAVLIVHVVDGKSIGNGNKLVGQQQEPINIERNRSVIIY